MSSAASAVAGVEHPHPVTGLAKHRGEHLIPRGGRHHPDPPVRGLGGDCGRSGSSLVAHVARKTFMGGLTLRDRRPRSEWPRQEVPGDAASRSPVRSPLRPERAPRTSLAIFSCPSRSSLAHTLSSASLGLARLPFPFEPGDGELHPDDSPQHGVDVVAGASATFQAKPVAAPGGR